VLSCAVRAGVSARLPTPLLLAGLASGGPPYVGKPHSCFIADLLSKFRNPSTIWTGRVYKPNHNPKPDPQVDQLAELQRELPRIEERIMRLKGVADQAKCVCGERPAFPPTHLHPPQPSRLPLYCHPPVCLPVGRVGLRPKPP
jgi:hypothetical protein